jgi:hypothetical protein
MILGNLALTDLPHGAFVYKLARTLASAIAGAIEQRLFEVRSAQNLADLAGSINLHRTDVASFVANGGSVHVLAAFVNVEASVLAYDDITRIFAVVALFAVPIVWFIPLTRARN